MKIWILLTIAGLLLLWSLMRERFEATASIRAPPYNDEAKIRIYEVASTANQQKLMQMAKQQQPSETDQNKLKAIAGGIVAPAVGDFFNAVFKPATQPITPADVTNFMANRTSNLKDIEQDVLTTYFVTQQGIGTAQTSGYADILAGMGQNVGYLTNNTGAGGAGGGAGGTGGTGGTAGGAGGGAGGGTGGGTAGGAGTAEDTGGGATEDSAAGATEDTAGGTTGDSTSGATGGTTGGSTPSPSSPTDRRRQVFGPTFAGYGSGDGNGITSDSTATNVYPELIGGSGDVYQGSGVTSASSRFTLGGSLPSASSLGLDGNARFFPFSRQPGDMDLIPDPYRLSRSFSQASYSSKTEPAPFLTDFSAFLQ